MSLHLKLGKIFLSTGRLIQSMAIMTMKPDDLIRFGREAYSRSAQNWSSAEILKPGLFDFEQELLDALDLDQGRLLLLGVGGGREAIPLAQAGFQITGVDFIPEMVHNAIQNAEVRGIKIEGSVQEISQLQLPEDDPYRVIWFSPAQYSAVPTRQRRVATLKTLRQALTPDGRIVCQFHWEPERRVSRKTMILRRTVALLTWGNFSYEPGDQLWGNIEFIHSFAGESEVREEFVQAGLDVISFHIFPNWHRAAAILTPARSNPDKI